MSSIDNAKAILNDLNAKVQAGDVEGGKSALAQIKILMLDFPTGSAASEIAASALEFGVLLSVADEDLDAFARNVSQLKSYYAVIPAASASSKKYHILGLNLMYLLVENRLSEFHAELELLTPSEASAPHVSFPINLERQLMVGLYDEVLNAGKHVPDPSYDFFMDNLLQTVRDSIADCLEVSYKTMSIADAASMMKFDTTEDLTEYIEECRDDWIVEGGALCFQPPQIGSKATDIPSMKLMQQSLSYATELERIV
uniref:PCI domain-containing protein n=1 Tax=Eucampia antarctica TaxID=49252 RepID=A0A7S2R780_9STRA|mmetsp:Transcript_18044/g.17395  ORF Transcript_18044/g.17395 Transcript_18044/m.17395 type:complete len:256 (+) Transcript_18044:213-980(+)|eukprot:CAMPEP_0197832904 /NCGR_PEP_ID=MMETSP1437-20131217/16750_1 /TAXON_ID=49252 ORGANISM="Eucampia antarctica, Strain CCMP1452" /NCGR_SAMPLE_ID=MMETSP1437 /ASSEMBLY_ACC=CAM_ASM_001096 /LENGTH=255 /DNA_ID=CAMNT_0043436549 /DNA_START=163 /DNA_END=930 /DNA_ORIENTATION=-